MTEERRRHSRVSVKVRAEGGSAPSVAHSWSGEIIEMSTEGLTIQMSRSLKVGTECALTLEGGLRCRGAVVHCRRKGPTHWVGVRIVDAAPVEKFKFFRYIKTHQTPAHSSSGREGIAQ